MGGTEERVSNLNQEDVFRRTKPVDYYKGVLSLFFGAMAFCGMVGLGSKNWDGGIKFFARGIL